MEVLISIQINNLKAWPTQYIIDRYFFVLI